MKENIKIIQEKLLKNLDRLDNEEENLQDEVARSNAVSQLANTYIKTCNLIIRVEEAKIAVKGKLDSVNEE